MKKKKNKCKTTPENSILSCKRLGTLSMLPQYIFGPWSSPEHPSSIRKNLQLPVQWHYFTSQGWLEHKEVREAHRHLVWGTGMCSEKKALFVVFLDTDGNSSLWGLCEVDVYSFDFLSGISPPSPLWMMAVQPKTCRTICLWLFIVFWRQSKLLMWVFKAPQGQLWLWL